MPSARATRAAGATGIVSAIAVVAGLLLFWAITAPPLATVDEPRHVNSVLRLVQGGGWPPPYTAKMTEGTLVAMQEAGHPVSGVPDIDPPAAEDRSVVTDLTDAGYGDAMPRDWMNQHPPTYYGMLAGALVLMGAEDWRWDQQVMAMRILSLSMVVGAVIFVAGSLRRMTGSVTATILGVLAIAGVPQFFNILSLVTNDALAVLASSGFLYFLVRAWREPRTRTRAVLGWSVGAGALLGLGLLTKGTVLATIPVVFVVLLVIGWRLTASWPVRLAPAAISMLVAFAVGGWWYLRNILVYGEIQASNSGTGRNPAPAEGYDFGRFVSSSLLQLAESFWGSIRATLDVPPLLLGALVTLVIAALVTTLVWSRDRLFVALLLVMPACIAGLILFHAWEVYWNRNFLAGVQGRYFFGAITLYSLILALAWMIVMRRASVVVRAGTAVLAGVGFLLVGMWGARYAFVERWASPDGAFQAWQDAAAAGPFDPVGLTIVAVTVVAAALIALVAEAWVASDDRSGVNAVGAQSR